MSICTFFGHSQIYEDIKPRLREVLIDLIENKGVSIFYLGNHGKFDSIVRRELKALTQKYPHIKYSVVLAYLPSRQNDIYRDDDSDTVYPDVLANVPPKYAIVKRNQWMIEQADYVVTYVTVCYGGAARFKELAEKKGKNVLNI